MPGSLRRRFEGATPRAAPERAMVEDVIEYLEWIAVRPAMYFGDRCGRNAWNSLGFFRQAFEFAGLDIDPGIDAVAEHGWRPHSPTGIVGQMHEKGMSEAETAEEVVRIEIDKWRALLERLGGPAGAANEPLRSAAADFSEALADPSRVADLIRATCTLLEYVAGSEPSDADWRVLAACSRSLMAAPVAASGPDRVADLLCEAGHAFVWGIPADLEQLSPVGPDLLARARALKAKLEAEEAGQ